MSTASTSSRAKSGSIPPTGSAPNSSAAWTASWYTASKTARTSEAVRQGAEGRKMTCPPPVTQADDTNSDFFRSDYSCWFFCRHEVDRRHRFKMGCRLSVSSSHAPQFNAPVRGYSLNLNNPARPPQRNYTLNAVTCHIEEGGGGPFSPAGGLSDRCLANKLHGIRKLYVVYRIFPPLFAGGFTAGSCFFWYSHFAGLTGLPQAPFGR